MSLFKPLFRYKCGICDIAGICAEIATPPVFARKLRHRRYLRGKYDVGGNCNTSGERAEIATSVKKNFKLLFKLC